MAHLIQIGNSQGVRIPKAMIAQANLANKELTFKVTDDGLLIAPQKKAPRDGWLVDYDPSLDEDLWKDYVATEHEDDDWQW